MSTPLGLPAITTTCSTLRSSTCLCKMSGRFALAPTLTLWAWGWVLARPDTKNSALSHGKGFDLFLPSQCTQYVGPVVAYALQTCRSWYSGVTHASWSVLHMIQQVQMSTGSKNCLRWRENCRIEWDVVSSKMFKFFSMISFCTLDSSYLISRVNMLGISSYNFYEITQNVHIAILASCVWLNSARFIWLLCFMGLGPLLRAVRLCVCSILLCLVRRVLYGLRLKCTRLQFIVNFYRFRPVNCFVIRWLFAAILSHPPAWSARTFGTLSIAWPTNSTFAIRAFCVFMRTLSVLVFA